MGRPPWPTTAAIRTRPACSGRCRLQRGLAGRAGPVPGPPAARTTARWHPTPGCGRWWCHRWCRKSLRRPRRQQDPPSATRTVRTTDRCARTGPSCSSGCSISTWSTARTAAASSRSSQRSCGASPDTNSPVDRAVCAQQTSACIQRQVQALRALRSAPVLPRSGCRRGETGRLKSLSSDRSRNVDDTVARGATPGSPNSCHGSTAQDATRYPHAPCSDRCTPCSAGIR